VTVNVLCVVFAAPHVTELAAAAEALRGKIAANISFIFDKPYATAAANAAALRARGIDSFDSDGRSWSPSADASGAPPAGWRRRMRQWLRALPVPLTGFLLQAGRYVLYAQLLAYPFWLLVYWRHRNKCRRVLRDRAVGLVLLAVDAAYYDTVAWVKVCKELGIPSALIPFGMADVATLADERSDIWAFHARLPENRLLARLYPRWHRRCASATLVTLPAAQALAKEHLGLSGRNPWVYNASHADRVLLESRYAKEQLLAQDATLDNLVITGRPAHDAMQAVMAQRNSTRSAIAASHGFDPGKTIVVAALTPDKFAVFGGRTEFASYRDMIEFWIATLAAAPGTQILVSVHPSDSPDNVRYLERDGVRIAREPLARLIPIADLYVTDSSATARLAAACSVPVLDYDLYRFALAFNRAGAGLVYVDNKEDFIRESAQLLHDPARLGALRGLQVSTSSDFGLLDGCAGERIGVELAGLLNHPPAKASLS
jgi:hypothetical protein